MVERYRVDAAWVRLRDDLLVKRGRGDEITIAECQLVGGGVPFDRMRGRIRRYFASRGLSIIAIAGVGYRIATSEQEVHEVAPKLRRASIGRTARELKALASADERSLSASSQQYRMREIERVAARLERARADAAQSQREIASPQEPLPLLRERGR